MYPSVSSQFVAFNKPFEGSVSYMYLDIKGLVTIGVGNLIDPVSEAVSLPFQFKNRPGIDNPGGPATPDQIAEEWQSIKANTALAKEGYKACDPCTQLELDDDAIGNLILKRLTANETLLTQQAAFADFETWPADAQMALLSMAWALGAGGVHNFHNFSAACANMDFASAATECRISEVGNPGVAPRNRANVLCFLNAAAVNNSTDGSLDPTQLYYPQAL